MSFTGNTDSVFNRYFGSIFNQNKSSPVFQYIFDKSIVIEGQEQTGWWRPYSTTDLPTISGVEMIIGDVSITGTVTLATGTFTHTLNIITSSQVTIPSGAKSFSYVVESGAAYVNNNLINQGYGEDGGGYDNFVLNAPINVGCTGGRVLVAWEI